jgi:hypothetical protein
MTVSATFKLALLKKRSEGVRLYRLALRAGISPSMLSAITHGAQRVRSNDPRVIKIGALIGLTPDECFAVEASERGL